MLFAIAPVLFFSLSLKRGLSVMAERARERYRITRLRRMAGLLGAVACVIARCCVRVVFVIQLSRSSQALSWLEHQDDVSGLTYIG